MIPNSRISAPPQAVKIERQICTALDDMDAIIVSPRPDRRFLEALIDRIIIHSDRTVEFILKTVLS